MNFFSDENRNNFNFKNVFKKRSPKKRYRCLCPIFSNIKQCCKEKICTCDCNCCDCSVLSCSCCSCSCGNIKNFVKNRPYCFAGIIASIFIFILILIIIIAVSVSKKKKEETNSENSNINLKNFATIESKYKDLLNHDDGTLTEFCNYLSSKYSTLSEEDKVKLTYRWLTENIVYDKDGDVERNPDKFFQSKTTVCAGYASLFTQMLKAMNYNEENIKNISGYAKGDEYDVNTEQEKLKADHQWNAVKINGKWCLIDATWDAGKTNYTYFCTDPKCFVRDHLPEKSENQFLDKTIDLTTFHNLAWTNGLFCELNGEIIADKSISYSCSGKYTFKYDSKYDDQIGAFTKKEDENKINKLEIKKIKSGVVEINYQVKSGEELYIHISKTTMVDSTSYKHTAIASLFVKCS